MSYSSSVDLLAFAEPSSISTRQFLTQAYQQPSRDGIDYVYTPNTSAVIELSGMSMNQFVIPETMRLVYHAIHNVTTVDTGGSDPAALSCPLLTSDTTLQHMPGVVFVGAPHLGSVVCDIPGLSSDGFSLLQSDSRSQVFYNARLLCSGNDGFCTRPGHRGTFKQLGRAHAAGARSVVERAEPISGKYAVRAFNSAGVAGVVKREVRGGFMRYEVPASAFLALASGSTSLLPLSYLTGSSTNLSLRVNWAATANVMQTAAYSSAITTANYFVGGVALHYQAVNILDARILSSIQSLFRGERSMPVTATLSVPVPMMLKYQRFQFGSFQLQAPSGSVSLRVPASAACCDAVLVKVTARFANSDAAHGASKFFMSPAPSITDLSIRIGSAQFPARNTGDVYYTAGQVVRGVGSSKFLLNAPTVGDAQNAAIGTGPLCIQTSSGVYHDLYRAGRQFFSFYTDDDFDASPASELFEGPSGVQTVSLASERMRCSGYAQDPNIIVQYGEVSQKAMEVLEVQEAWVRKTQSPNLYLIPLSSFAPQESSKARGGALCGVDLRNQADIELNMTIRGVCNGNEQVPDEQTVAVTGWDVDAIMSVSELCSILPSRVDTRASASALPSAAAVTASAGTMGG